MRITFLYCDGREQTIDAPAGATLMQAAVAAGVEGILAECGGSAMCATCHVYLEEPFAHLVPPVNAVEHEMLESTASERRPTSRLSCQVTLTPELDGLRVALPHTQV